MGRRGTFLLAALGITVGMLALVVCLVGFSSWYANGAGASDVLAAARAARPVHVARGGHHHPIGRTVPAALSEETESSTDGLPANAGLLTALLLGFLFGPAAGWRNSASSPPLGPRPARPASCRFFSVVCFLQRRSLSTLSGVFRL
jgi:hypothetical protein